MNTENKCPVTGGTRGTTNREWWPEQLDLGILHQHSPLTDPMGGDFDYAREFRYLDLHAVRRDIEAVMTTSVVTGLPVRALRLNGKKE